MEYLVGGKTHFVSYKELKDAYTSICDLSDSDFLRSLPKALHLACVICWFKEVHRDHSIGDEGIIHKLVHLLNWPDGQQPEAPIGEVRADFREILFLA